MYVVTGAGGFIGRNTVLEMNRLGMPAPLVVDEPTGMSQLENLEGLIVAGYLGKEEFLDRLENDRKFSEKIKVIFHEGACSSTIEQDMEYLMRVNFHFTVKLLQLCSEFYIVVQYASSAGVYGANHVSRELPKNEEPLTAYAQSKLMIDLFLREAIRRAQGRPLMPATALRYFNVYGMGEWHKGCMRSVPLVFYEQLLKTGKIKVFGEYGGYEPGEHRRDFIFIEDLIKLKFWCLRNCFQPVILNAGTGMNWSFNDVAKAVIDFHGSGEIEYIPFPEHLKNSYQCYTKANLEALHAAGYKEKFTPIDEGVKKYLTQIKKSGRLESSFTCANK